MRGTVVLLGWLLVLAMSTVGQTHAQSGRSKARQPLAPRRVENPPMVLDHEVKRSILALYDGAEEASEDLTRVHKLLELPLNHLGYRVAYWDIRKGLPTVSEAMRHRAVATWFGERIPSAHAYLTWARRVARETAPA